ncbi:MAG TPA: FAD-binding oxidoreductase [Candidatus Saccharimonadales bacterium]|nr:FAD-binding oxidoreductase [Candidatus Saccharimonadales bacterium]
MEQQKLNAIFQGRVVFPGDSEYDQARQVFYGGIDKKPAAIIRVANTTDVQRAARFAQKEKLELAIRSGGHSVAGYSTTDGGLVIDMRDMRNITIDAAHKTMWAGAGLTAKEVTDALDKQDFVLGFGDAGSVGIGGITLNGGVGFLVRKFGLAIDNLLAAEIVIASGEILQVDESNHPELFWALKGGGGNFGVVTKFQYRLHNLGDCYGGMLMLPATPEVIAGCIKVAQEAPDELSVILNVMPAFPLPFVPKEHHGKMAAMALIMYAGDPAKGEAAVAPLKALAQPYADTTKPMRYKDIFFPGDASYHPTAVSRNMHLRTFGVKDAETALEWLDKLNAPMKALQLRALGGAMAKIPEDATAYANRKQPIMANIAAFYGTEDEKQEHQQWIEGFSSALDQNDSSAYVGFLGPTEQHRLLDAYPQATLDKLREVKANYDPDNFFRLNFNIVP